MKKIYKSNDYLALGVFESNCKMAGIPIKFCFVDGVPAYEVEGEKNIRKADKFL